MGFMDQFSEGAPTFERMEGRFAKAPDRAALWVNRTPFEVNAPPQIRPKRAEFARPRPDGSVPDPNEWVIPIRLLEPRGDGSFGYTLQDDGEGSQTTVDLLLSLSCTPQRNYIFERMARHVAERGPVGPFRLDKGDGGSKGQPPWVLTDWTPSQAQPAYASQYQGYQSAPPTTSAPVNASASQPAPSMHLTSVAPAYTTVPVPPPPPADVAPPPPPPPADEYRREVFNGQPHRWKPGMANWEPDLDTVSAQPLPPTRIVQGHLNSEGMASETVAMEVADGSQMRQAVYQGDGAVQQPSGVVTQNAAPEGSQTAATAPAGAIGVEAQATAPGAVPSTSRPPTGTVIPTPAQQPAPSAQTATGVARQAYEQGRQVMVSLECPTCNLPQKGPAFRRPSDGRYIQTHVCKTLGRNNILDATEAVKAAAGVS